MAIGNVNVLSENHPRAHKHLLSRLDGYVRRVCGCVCVLGVGGGERQEGEGDNVEKAKARWNKDELSRLGIGHSNLQCH